MAYQDFAVEPNDVELYVRFAYMLIVKDYHQRPADYDLPVTAIKGLRDRFAGANDLVLDVILCAFQFLISRGVSARFARTAMIERARRGLGFRSVVFVDYKATRRRDPRVTNRGVTARGEQEGNDDHAADNA